MYYIILYYHTMYILHCAIPLGIGMYDYHQHGVSLMHVLKID